MPNNKNDKSKKDKSDLTSKDAYEEIGRSYRFFLNWRYALIAGYFVSLGAIGKVLLESWDQQPFVLPFLLFVILFGVTEFFYQLEIRNRDLYHYCTQQGKVIEDKLKIKGVYTRLNELDGEINSKSKYLHSNTIDWFFKLWRVISVLGVLVYIGVFICISR